MSSVLLFSTPSRWTIRVPRLETASLVMQGVRPRYPGIEQQHSSSVLENVWLSGKTFQLRKRCVLVWRKRCILVRNSGVWRLINV